MTTHTDLEQILSYFINLIEKNGLHQLRQSTLYPSEEEILSNFPDFKLNPKAETVTYTDNYYNEEDKRIEVPKKISFPEMLKERIKIEKSILYKRIIWELSVSLTKHQNKIKEIISKRLAIIIARAQNDELIIKYPFLIEALLSIDDYLSKDYINDMPPSERLKVNAGKDTTVLLFLLLLEAGYLSYPADLASFLDNRISYLKNGKGFSPVSSSKQLISDFTTNKKVNSVKIQEEIKKNILKAEVTITKKHR